MKKYFIIEGLFLLVLALLFAMKSIAPEKLAITTSSQTGQIYFNGVQTGKDKSELKKDKSSYITAAVKQEK